MVTYFCNLEPPCVCRSGANVDVRVTPYGSAHVFAWPRDAKYLDAYDTI
jgi:hypothetical protein